MADAEEIAEAEPERNTPAKSPYSVLTSPDPVRTKIQYTSNVRIGVGRSNVRTSAWASSGHSIRWGGIYHLPDAVR